MNQIRPFRFIIFSFVLAVFSLCFSDDDVNDSILERHARADHCP